MEEQKRQSESPPKTKAPGTKTVGVPVPPALYKRLVLVKERHGLSSIKAAVLMASDHGCAALLNEKKAPRALRLTKW